MWLKVLFPSHLLRRNDALKQQFSNLYAPKNFYLCGLYLSMFTILEIKTKKLKKILLIHLKRTITNSLHININNMFLMKNNCFPKQKQFSGKRDAVSLCNVCITKDSWVLRSASAFILWQYHM